MNFFKELGWRKLTIGMVGLVIVFLSTYDVAAYYGGGVDATISRVVWSFAKDYPIIPLLFGILAGHLFWPQHIEKKD